MKDDEYIQEEDDSGKYSSTSDMLSSEVALSRLRHPSYRNKMKLSNPTFNNELLEGAGEGKHQLLLKYSDFALSTFIPVILAVIFINTVAMKFFGMNLLF